MSCGKDHFTPLYLGPPPEVLRLAPKRHGWGGRRRGAGAPKGNLNAMRHGRHSRYHKQLADLLAEIPEIRESLIALAKRQRRQQRRAQAGAAALIAALFQRVGEAVLNPQDNHLENDQEFLDLIRSLQAQFEELHAKQSSDNPQNRASINRPSKGQL